MTYQELDSVVLVRDLPIHALRSGDAGTIVHVHNAEAFEVEFICASGATAAVIELTSADLRPATDDDQLSVRRRTATALAK
jgi:hypothetical protein